jgi:hypothetical protein
MFGGSWVSRMIDGVFGGKRGFWSVVGGCVWEEKSTQVLVFNYEV